MLCDLCAIAIERIDPRSACTRCGAPGGLVRCAECENRRFSFAGARCAALLEPPVSTAIITLKDGGERRCASVLAELLAEVAVGWLEPGEALVPVPASPGAFSRRGFDHARDIARALGRATSSDVSEVLRSARSSDQRVLGRDARFENKAGTFSVLPWAEVPARIVLVDDVFTTGATMEAAAAALMAGGARRVRSLAVARSMRR